MRIGIITLFPEMFEAITGQGVTGRACKQGLVEIRCWNPRDFTTDKHRTVDERPFGGGPGMLMKTEPLQGAIRRAREGIASTGEKTRVIYLSPQGRTLDQQVVVELAARRSMILLCGRYQGIDQRLRESEVDEEISVGDYVLSGGELAAMVVLDAIIRYQPGALGHEDSAQEDSFAKGLLDSPHYTRPQEFSGRTVPAVLLNGNHEEIRRWRLKQRLGVTWLKRPDLLKSVSQNIEQQELLKQFIDEYQSD